MPNNPDGTGPYFSYDTAAAYLDISSKTLRRAVADNAIPYLLDPLTGRVRFARRDLDEWMHGRTLKRGAS